MLPILFEYLNNTVAGFLRQAAPAVASFIFECSPQLCLQLGISVPAMKSKLFDVIVRSTMGYGVEMWGPGYLMSTAALAGRDKAEVLHRGFLKKILGVRTTSPDAITYSEFGRYPLRCSWQRSIYSYWKRITEL